MGVIRHILFISVFLIFWNSSAQKIRDTVSFDGEFYIEHIVSAGESIKSIAKIHKIKISDLLENNEIDTRLYYNQLLYIPFKKNKTVTKNKLIPSITSSNSDVVNIALLMPYYLIKNDTMFNQYEDELDESKIYYNQSESALSFHIGIELAIDSLRRAGKNIVLHTFDTNKDTLVVKKLVYSNHLDKMDIIIGPMYSRFFRILCKRYGNVKNKILISPLSRNNKGLERYSSVYQVAPSYKVQANILVNYLIKNQLNDNIIILHDQKTKSLSADVIRKFRKVRKKVDAFEIIHTETDSIRSFFSPKQHVLLLSSNKAFLSKMLASMGSIDSTSIVYTFESIKSYENLDITNLMELNVHIPNSSFMNYSSQFDVSFLNLYEREFHTNVRKYTKTGYNLVMQFCGQNRVYDFKRKKRGYHENLLAPIYHYYDYELVPVN